MPLATDRGNRKDSPVNRLKKYALAGLTAAVAAGVPATLAASSASAAVRPPVTASTQIVNRADNGGHGIWAHDSFTRKLVLNYLGKSTDPLHAAAPFMYNALIQDKGTFTDIPGRFTPDQGGNDLGKHLRVIQVSGPMSGYGQFGLFYASARAHNGLVPTVLRGEHLNSLYPSPTWPELAFPTGTTFVGVGEAAYDYNYQAVPFTKHTAKLVNGKWVIVTTHGYRQHWEDSSWNGDGQLGGKNNIIGLR
jgi:hypothetical protein